MIDTKCPNPLGPIPKWVRQFWKGDKPYPRFSLAERNARLGRDATDRRAVADLARNLPHFEKSSLYELIYIDRSGGVSREHAHCATDAIFSSSRVARLHVRRHGYKSLSSHDTPTKMAYERPPNK